MADADTFKDELATFVQARANGNKTKAAAILKITRQEVHAYLGERQPRADKLARLRAAIALDGFDIETAPRPEGQVDGPPREMAFQLVRYLYDLVEDARARSRR